MRKIPEVLAPAGNMEAIIAGINGGADAVYFGGKLFNARQNAGNMSEDEIKYARELCREHGVKVYITLNTLVKNSEMSLLMETLNFLKDLDLDGIIVQDIGIIYIIKKYFPELKLQTSTQASVYGIEGVRFFEEQGFTRVVLPREMSITEVGKIKKETQVELKIFCHGALCYAYSGQCLLSSMIGGRSGNRGLCAQPCRKTYELMDDFGDLLNSGYLLSPKDLNVLDDMNAIINSGVDAIKIEGRMKTPEYVYGITKAYREKIEKVCGKEVEETMDNDAVMQVFNRNFTRGHLFNEADILNNQVGKNRGTCVGEVLSLGKRIEKKREYEPLGIKIYHDQNLAIGDGLSFGEDGKIGSKVDALFNLKGKRIETGGSGESVAIPCRYRVAPGTVIYKNHDANLMKKLKTEGSKKLESKKDIIDFKISIDKDKPVFVSGCVKGMKAEYCSDFIPEKPMRNPLTQEMVIEQLSRLGGTDFELGKIEIALQPDLFLTRGQLNQCRKEIVKIITEKQELNKESNKIITKTVVLNEDPIKKKQNLFNQATKKRVSIQFDQMPTDGFLLGMKEFPITEIVLPMKGNETLEKVKMVRDFGVDVLVATPKVMNRQLSKKIRNFWTNEVIETAGIKGILITNYEGLNIFKDRELFLEGDQSLNIFNNFATNALEKWGLSGGVMSPELEDFELKEISESANIPMVLPVFGAQELMVSKKCLFNCKDCPDKKSGKTGNCHKVMTGELVDERHEVFPVRRDENGVIHIYNGNRLFLREEILDLGDMDKWRIYHRKESIDELSVIADFYGERIYKAIPSLPEGLTTKNTTRGSYKRGVK